MKLDQSLSGYRKYLESVYTEKVDGIIRCAAWTYRGWHAGS